jgi:hypothetical protein
MNAHRKIYQFLYQFLFVLLIGALTSGPVCSQQVSRATADEILNRYLRDGKLATSAARSELEAALGVYRQIGDLPGQAKILVLLGLFHDAADQHPQAMASYNEARNDG